MSLFKLSDKKNLPQMVVLAIAMGGYSQTTRAESVTQLETMNVSVNKITEDPQTASSSVTIMTAEDIKNKGIRDIDDITKVLPNTVNGSSYSGTTDWNYRGLNSSAFKGNNPVIIYIDGVSQIDRKSMFVDMKNVERIEIVHGPSGTIHGKGAIGGVINIITKQSKNEFSGELSVEIAEEGKKEGALILSGPLIDDKLLAKLSLSASDYDGYLEYVDSSGKDNFDFASGHNFSADIQYFINDNSSLSLQLVHNEEDTGYGLIDVLQEQDVNSDRRPDELDFNTESRRDGEADIQSLRYDYDFDELRFEAQLSHRNAEYGGVYECDYTNVVNIECVDGTEIDDLDAEFRLISDYGRLKWVAGVFVGKNEKEIKENGYNFGTSPIALSEGEHIEDTWALFGQMNYPLTEQWQLTLGGRFQVQRYETDTHYYAAANPQYGIPEINSYNKGSEQERSFLPKIGLSYAINEQHSLYGSFARGVLAGGYNDFQSNIAGADDAYFKPQYNNSFELGYKGRLDNLRWTANLFYMDIDDIHTYTVQAGSLFTAGNLKGAESKGFELEAKYQINRNWSMDLSMGYTHAEYKNGALFNGEDAGGKKVEKTPEGTAAIGLDYHLNQWEARIESVYRGDYYYNFQNDKKIDGFNEFNARVSWQKKDLEVFAYINNITDETGVTTAFDVSALGGPGLIQRALNKSRHAGLGLNYQF